MLKQKWKLFAVGHYFNSDELTVGMSVKLFDDLAAADTGYDCEELLKPMTAGSPRLWPEYANTPIENVAVAMRCMAMHAQDVENMEV